MALLVLLQKHNSICIEEISNNIDIYNSHVAQVEIDGFANVIDLLIKFERIYSLLKDDSKTIILKYIKETGNYLLGRFLKSTFLSENVEKHIQKIIIELDSLYMSYEFCCIKPNDLRFLYEKAKEVYVVNDFYKMCIIIYSKSNSYDVANDLFSKCIKPYMIYFDKDIIALCFLID